ncbi:hypothetical protein AVDCRST_MAG81-192 [uncultured Synechococcales cyanobacterium]|uniref:Uncharacterized protein n=1 Tax=uncultured Synechococcales cyanobacterium TaxID=1936017 RepID=A0A6J4UND0_9CYAN|nr:hypothetical protein AVDCRST_MAG81-192 [uncultured Synechococcales cyanobacterium]
MKLLTTYSINPADDFILNQLAPQLWQLSREQLAAIAIAALFEGYEPASIDFDYCCSSPSGRFEECVVLLQLLSLAGKLALCRAILEHLTIVEMAGKREGISRSDNFCTLAVLAANSEV